MKFVYILVGGALGALLRYLVTLWSAHGIGAEFPFGTLVVNLVGCFLVGLIFGIAEIKGINPSFRIFFITGFLGALTTFSTYALESIISKDLKFMAVNVLANNVGGLMFAAIGLILGRAI